MTEAEQISAFANVPRPLANLVVHLANKRGVSVKEIRGECRLRSLCHVRWEIAATARRHDFSLWQIARALNRDHSTVVHGLHRAVETGENPTISKNPTPVHGIEQSMNKQEELRAA